MKKDSDPNKIKMSPPSCLVPNIKATRQIANNILDGTTERLSLPIFNMGFPKAGTYIYVTITLIIRFIFRLTHDCVFDACL
jgi:hypothetical protein